MLKKFQTIAWVLALNTAMINTCTIAVNETITKIEIAKKFYPAGFEQELQANMNYFLDGVGVSTELKMPYDYVLVNGDKIFPSEQQFNISTVGLYIGLLIEMVNNGDEKAILRLNSVLSQLEKMPKWKGMFYWMYKNEGGELAPTFGGIASVVDNGNMAFSLAGLNGAFYDHSDRRLKKLAKRAQKLLDGQIANWQELYDPNRGLLRAGWNDSEGGYLRYYIDRKANESRLGVLWAAMTVREVPESAFNNMELYTGSVELNGKTVEPILPWDGSYFQAMMPALWVDESKYVPNYSIFLDFSAVHRDYAEKHKIPFLSASSNVSNGYAAYGLASVSESVRAFGNNIATGKTGTPHALALYYMVNPQDAVSLLQKVKSRYPQIETIAGWADAVHSSGLTSKKVIGLDQGMFVGAFIAKAVRANVMRYIDQNGYEESLLRMYLSFVPNSNLN